MAAILVNLVKDLGLDPNMGNILQRTPLHVAAMHGNTTMINELLFLGAEIAARDSRGQTPLHLAVMHRKGEAVCLLLSRGCPVDAKDKEGNTALHLATVYDMPTVVRELLAHGASREEANAEGETPVSLAEIYGHDWVSKYFTWHGETADHTPRGQLPPQSSLSAALSGKKQQPPVPGSNRLSIKLRVAGKEVVFDDVEMVEVAGDHNLEALVPSVA